MKSLCQRSNPLVEAYSFVWSCISLQDIYYIRFMDVYILYERLSVSTEFNYLTILLYMRWYVGIISSLMLLKLFLRNILKSMGCWVTTLNMFVMLNVNKCIKNCTELRLQLWRSLFSFVKIVKLYIHLHVKFIFEFLLFEV